MKKDIIVDMRYENKVISGYKDEVVNNLNGVIGTLSGGLLDCEKTNTPLEVATKLISNAILVTKIKSEK